jgi:hypothetical protein
VKTLAQITIFLAAAVVMEVDRWNDRYNPRFSKQDVEDMVTYLDRDFYKFTR